MSKRQLQIIATETPVTSFMDYRDFLSEIFTRAKSDAESYSYLAFAEDLGFSATNVIRLVIARQRTLAMKSAKTIVESLELRKEHRRYFIAMVQYANARSAELRHKHFRDMLEIKQETVENDGDRDRMSYFSDWYHPVLREMQRLNSFRSEPEWIAKALYPNTSTENIQKSLALLQSLGLTAENAAPQLLPSDATAGHLSIARFHQTMIELARQAVTDVPSARREVNALTLALSDEQFKELRKRIREFCSEVLEAESKPQPRECVAQVNIQLFTLTKPLRNGKEG